jgi:hypothetical protein
VGTVGVGAGVARVATISGVTAPAENFAARTYLNIVDKPNAASLYNSFEAGTARLNVEFGGRTLYRAANNEAHAAAGRFASIQMPTNPAVAIRNSALNPALSPGRPNLATELYAVRSHTGLSVQGTVAAQGPGFPGGFTQVFQTPLSTGSPWVGRPAFVPYPAP